MATLELVEVGRRGKSARKAPALSPGARRCRRKFLSFYPGGFADEEYVALERDYKWRAHVQWDELLNRDTFTVQLLDTDEHLRSFRIADLSQHGFEETPMPPASKKLTQQQIADVVTYLASLRGEVTQ